MTRKSNKVRLLVNLACLTFLLVSTFAGHTAAQAAPAGDAEPQWEFVTIPGLPAGSVLYTIWTSGPGDVYVWSQRTTPGTTDVPESTLFHWDGVAWSAVLSLPGHAAGDVFGTGPTDVYAGANRCSTGYAAGCGADKGGQLYRSTDGGLTWTLQALPAAVAGETFAAISGTPGNVHLRTAGPNYTGHIIRFDGSTWSTFSAGGDQVSTLTVFSANEGYYGTCWGWGWWDGTSWQYHGTQFDFCDIGRMWGMRDGNGALHLYVVGSNNFGNGVRVWRFDEGTQSFGSKYGTVFSDGDGYLVGTATGIWGSAPDDVYVIGRIGDWYVPNSPTRGRLYHFDGTNWRRVTEIGDIPQPRGISGSSATNVWIALEDGRILRYMTPVTSLTAHVVETTDFYPGDPVTVDLDIQDADGLYAAQALCTVDPSVLELQEGTFGDFFDPTLRLVAANQADAASGEWLGAISQQNPAGPLSGDGLYATLTYLASAPGTTELTCEPLFADRDGFSLPVTFSGIEITVIPFGVVNGTAFYQGRLTHEGIAVTATGPVTQTVFTDAEGAFSLDALKAGDYIVAADAPSYLPSCTDVDDVVSGGTITLPGTTLVGGDVNDFMNSDLVIDIGDLTLLTGTFNDEVPPIDPPIEPAQADINGDGVVNVQDLAILAGNYGLFGCQDW